MAVQPPPDTSDLTSASKRTLQRLGQAKSERPTAAAAAGTPLSLTSPLAADKHLVEQLTAGLEEQKGEQRDKATEELVLSLTGLRVRPTSPKNADNLSHGLCVPAGGLHL